MMNGVKAIAKTAIPNRGRYLIQPRAITVNDKLMENARFIIPTPAATKSLMIGNQSTESKDNNTF